MDRFVSMSVFVRVVESSSFAATARHFNISPAMASKHVQALEARLGARLLNRTTRRVSPTEVGQGYYERCRQILAELDEADRAASDLQGAPRGLLRINAPLSFGIGHLGPAIADFLATYPEVSIDLALNDRYVDLLEEGFDLAVRIGQLADSSLIARRLAPVRLVACASPDYLARAGVPEAPRQLGQHNCLCYTLTARRGEWQFTGPDGHEESVQVSGRFQSNNGDVLATLAIRGEGIVLSPLFLVWQHLDAGRLVPLLPGYKPREAGLHAIYPPGRNLSRKVRTFVDFLAARFGREDCWRGAC